ncbi:MAG TPA: hypothetical protein VK428_06570 [Acidimicrobiales bacterium]|nr:hypothetical protein [Acidimicrobiales bacterium]
MRRPTAPAVATLAAVVGVIVVTVWSMDPSGLVSTSTITGGDTGSHVGLAWYLKTALLPHFHVTGWDPGAYDGYPLYSFYFPLPDLLAALGGYVIPFTVAFKLVTILGSLTLPVAAWAFGRLAGLERPRPAVLAAATLPFLFDQTFTIYGGNLYSTMAGEYAYSLGLSVALVFLGVVLRGMRTGRHRALAAVLLVVCVLCHLIAAILAGAGLVVALVLVGVTRRRLWWVASVAGTGGLLVAWWALPFMVEQPYSTNMGWVNVTTYAQMLAPSADRWALIVAAVGVVVAVAKRQRAAALLTVLGVGSALALVLDPQGKLYNTRFLPLWWLCVYLMVGYAVAEAGIAVASWWRQARPALALDMGPATGDGIGRTQRPAFFRPGAVGESGAIGTDITGTETSSPAGPRTAAPGELGARWHGGSWRWAPGAVAVPLLALAASFAVVLPPLLIPAGASYHLGPLHLTTDNVPSWAAWNYSGYQGKPGWVELDDGIIRTLDQATSRYGCGRAMWEYNSDENRFGTPEALMMLPYFTDGCVDSMEGLLFESASTTPFHFIDQSELSAQPSDAMVGLPYASTPNVVEGVEHLQLLGVKYFLAATPSIEAAADADPALSLIATSGPWHTAYQGTVVVTTWDLYLVHDAPMVAPLAEVPSVLQGVGPQQTSWLPVALKWYDDPASWSHELVAGGLASWPRQSADEALHSTGAPLAPVAVSDIRSSSDTIGFDVNRIGVPVVVRISYFPAWHATGAEGPWRAEPNLMVVVPTSRHVALSYGSTRAGWAGLGLGALGLVTLALLLRRRSRAGVVIF